MIQCKYFEVGDLIQTRRKYLGMTTWPQFYIILEKDVITFSGSLDKFYRVFGQIDQDERLFCDAEMVKIDEI